MPAPAPSVLRRLRALGLTQGMVATYLGASQSAVSLWETGKRPFEEPWQTEAQILLRVLTEHLAHGGTLATFRHAPGLDLVSGTPHRVATLRIPAEKALEYHKLQDELQEPALRAPGPHELALDGSARHRSNSPRGSRTQIPAPGSRPPANSMRCAAASTSSTGS